VTDLRGGGHGRKRQNDPFRHDLNTLAERQTDRNLQYSDFMHHSAGVFVLTLTLAIFVRELWPHYEPKVRWVGPTLLKVGRRPAVPLRRSRPVRVD